VIEDAVSESRVAPEAVIGAALSALERERDELLATRLVHLIGTTYQDHLASDRHHPLADRIRAGFGDRIAKARSRAQHARVASSWQRMILENRMSEEPILGIERPASTLLRASAPRGWRGGVGGVPGRPDLRDPVLRRTVAIALELPVVRLRPR